MKSLRDIWAVSLLIVGCVPLILSVCSFADIDLPDTLKRVLGVLDLLALIALVFTSVKLKIWKKGE